MYVELIFKDILIYSVMKGQPTSLILAESMKSRNLTRIFFSLRRKNIGEKFFQMHFNYDF
jgi:hypothetical protein